MKTIYSIGRDPGCDIYLYDDRNLISRTHAILKIGKGGKYFISDQSMNGTYVNGIKISQGVQVPVTRKDIISFAHVAELDWDMVPNTFANAWKFILIILCSGAVVAGLSLGVKHCLDKKDSNENVTLGVSPSIVNTAEQEELKKKEKAEKEAKYEAIEAELNAYKKQMKAEEAKRKKAEEAKKSEQDKKDAEEAKKAEEVKTTAEEDNSAHIY